MIDDDNDATYPAAIGSRVIDYLTTMFKIYGPTQAQADYVSVV